MKTRTLAAFLGCAMLTACGAVDGDFDTKKVVPEDRAVTLAVPGNAELAAAAGTGKRHDAVGQRAEFYALTYQISRTLNGHAIALLAVVRGVLAFPATTSDGDKRVWGPYTPGGLEPNTFRFTAEKTAEDAYTFVLEARPRASTAEADFRTLLEGATEHSGPAKVKGSLTLHLDAARALEPQGVCGDGKVTFVFDTTAEPRTISVQLRGFREGNPEAPLCRGGDTPTDADYAYRHEAGGAGQFLFSVKGDVHEPGENKPELEDIRIRSRWTADGSGRSDVTVSGGEVAADLTRAGLAEERVTVTECWDTRYLVTYESASPIEVRRTDGDPASCVFTAAELP